MSDPDFDSIISEEFPERQKTYIYAPPCTVHDCEYSTLRARATLLSTQAIHDAQNLALVIQLLHAHGDSLWADELEIALHGFLKVVNDYAGHAGFGLEQDEA